MKSIKLIITCIMLCAIMPVFNSCGKELDLNYREACESKDFSTAYDIVDKLKEETSKAKIEADQWIEGSEPHYIYKEAKKKSDEAERYVVLQESMFVLESEGINGLMRIVGIAKEHKAEEWLYSELLDVAKKIGDKELEERINNMISSSFTTK